MASLQRSAFDEGAAPTSVLAALHSSILEECRDGS